MIDMSLYVIVCHCMSFYTPRLFVPIQPWLPQTSSFPQVSIPIGTSETLIGGVEASRRCWRRQPAAEDMLGEWLKMLPWGSMGIHGDTYSNNIWVLIWWDVDMIWYELIWYDMIWYDMICHHMSPTVQLWFVIWFVVFKGFEHGLVFRSRTPISLLCLGWFESPS